MLEGERPEAAATEESRVATPASERGFQINIRRPLASLTVEQASRYLEKFADTSLVLMEQANPGRTVVRESATGTRLVLVPNLERLGASDAAEAAAALEVLIRLGSGG